MKKIDIKSLLLGFFIALSLFLIIGMNFGSSIGATITTSDNGKHVYASDGRVIFASHTYGRNWEVVKQ
ncbi:MAG TPA: hypothetical protein VKN74_00985 [Candidatus Mcinerneyibacterium sp.]|nr:hypothetical protein [Candidatus Mcinerneyibacterium sp.]